MSCIELKNVRKTFNQTVAVKDLSLNIPEGAIYGFIGPNGSGKSTSLRMIMSIIYPDSGSILIQDQNASTNVSQQIGYLPEERGLYQKMKVKELITFFAKLKDPAFNASEVDPWLERFELKAYADKKVETLSKGMSQKVQFISTVVTRPKILILDEPFSGLDPVNADTMRKAILELNKQGTTVVFSTHDMGTAERMCDRIFMIYKGEKVLDGTLNDIKNQYGADTIHVRIDDTSISEKEIAGVEKITDFGQEQELRLQEGANPQAVLHELLTHGAVHKFEVVTPSLHDIFVRIASPEPETN
jgi:ABC-2 type transport system ATP-binding protein